MVKLGTTKLSSRGQVVIPENIRGALNLKAGDNFIVLSESNKIVLKRLGQKEVDALLKSKTSKAKCDLF